MDKNNLNNNTSNNDKTNNDSKTKKIDNFEPKESLISSFFYNFTLSENIWNLLISMLLFGGIIATASYTIGMDSSEPYVTMITEISSVFILLGTMLFTLVWLSSRYDTFEPKEYANKYIYYSVFSSLIAIGIIVLHIIVLLNQTYSVMFAIPAIPFIIFSAYSANLVIRTDKTKLLEKELLYKSEKYNGEIDERLKNLVRDLKYPKSLQFNSLLWVTTINSLTYATILTLFTGPSENIINLILLFLILISVPSIILIYMLVYRFTLFGEYK